MPLNVLGGSLFIDVRLPPQPVHHQVLSVPPPKSSLMHICRTPTPQQPSFLSWTTATPFLVIPFPRAVHCRAARMIFPQDKLDHGTLLLKKLFNGFLLLIKQSAFHTMAYKAVMTFFFGLVLCAPGRLSFHVLRWASPSPF